MTQAYRYVYHEGDPAQPVWLALHGTGGDEHDLIPLITTIEPRWGYVSLRGTVQENGQNRFFKRFADGRFDQEDLAYRLPILEEFLSDLRKEVIGQRPLIGLGYSNGANMIASLLLANTSQLQGAVLLRPSMPFHPILPPSLNQLPVLVLSGALDTITPPHLAVELTQLLKKYGATVTHHTRPVTHGLTAFDCQLTQEFLKQLETRI